ncbi:hypothetical protein Goarm_013077, partial [Gossypium armourianum]|nr:hypothetical protein [Gossypium armourianum]
HVGGNVETRGAHIPPSIRRVHYTLEDVQLHLGLPVDGPVVIGSVHTANWRDVCEQLFGQVIETIFGSQIDMNWLRRIFCRLDEDSTKVQREQHARVYIFIIIGGLLMPDKLRNLAHLRWLLKLVNFREVGELSWSTIIGAIPVAIFTSSSGLPLYILTRNKWNHGPSYVGLLNELRDMQLLLDQRLEAELEWIHTPICNLRRHPIEILGQSQHLAREGVIGSVRYRGDTQ